MTKNWFERRDDARGNYGPNSQINIKTTMLKAALCDSINVSILFKGTYKNY